ncbi:uncharacterized protein LOC135499084 [Lineus longissimus]|uniref:uncharacterized protein LOC135499084 n=1 Tax=Lineus longissimus TaxID=88925 RepID=UPI00315C5532
MDVKIIDTHQVMDISGEPEMETGVLNLSTEGAVEGLLSAVNATEEQVMIGYLEDGQIVMKANAAHALPKDGATHQAQLCTTDGGELMVVFYSDQDGNLSLVEPETSKASGSDGQLVKVQYGAVGTDDYNLQSFYMPMDELAQAGVNLMSGDLPRVSSNDGNVLASLIESGAAVPIQPVGMKNETNKDAHLVQTEDGYQCSACPVKTRRLPDARCHIRTHTGEKPYECNQCKKRFARADYLTHHLRTHTGQKPYQCRECQRSFACKVNMNRHIQLHTQEKPYSCAVCGARFARKFYLSNHMNLHLKIKPYRCILCKHKFNQLSSLQGHVARHRHDKRYSCSLCAQKFYRNAGLAKHMKLHTDVRRYIFCPKCGKSSVTESSAKRHLAKCQGDIHFCKHCQKNFENLESYQAHIDALIAECKKTDTGDGPAMLLDDIASDDFTDDEDVENDQNNDGGGEAETVEMSNFVGKVMAMSDIVEKTVPESETHFVPNSKFGGKVLDDDSVDRENMENGLSDVIQESNSIGKMMALSDISRDVGIMPGGDGADTNLVSELDHVGQTVSSVQNDSNNRLYDFVHSVLGVESSSLLIDADGTQHIVIEMQPSSDSVREQTDMIDENKLVESAHHNDHQFAVVAKNGPDGLCIDEKPNKTEKPRHKCYVCEKTYSRRDNLLCHMRIHNGVKPHKCPQCAVTFVHKGNLNKHLKTHSTDRPYVCEVCFKAFARPTYLKHHRRIHTGEKPHQCDVCLKEFRLASVLSKHSLIHKNIRAHACGECGKRFRTKANRRIHEEKQHSKDVTFLCSTCKKHCSTKEELVNHCHERHKMALPAPGEDPMKFVIASDHGKVVLKQTTKACTPGLDALLSNLDAGFSSEDEDAIRLNAVGVPDTVVLPHEEGGKKSKRSGTRSKGGEKGSLMGRDVGESDCSLIGSKKTYKMVIGDDGNMGFDDTGDVVGAGYVESCSSSGKSWSAGITHEKESCSEGKGTKDKGQDGEAIGRVTLTKRKHRGKVFTELGGESDEDSARLDGERASIDAASKSPVGMSGKRMKLIKLSEASPRTSTSAPADYVYVSDNKACVSAANSNVSSGGRNDNVDDVAEILAQISEIPVLAAPTVTESVCVSTVDCAVASHSDTDQTILQGAPANLVYTCDLGTSETMSVPPVGDPGVAVVQEVEDGAYAVVQGNGEYVLIDFSDEVSVTAS